MVERPPERRSGGARPLPPRELRPAPVQRSSPAQLAEAAPVVVPRSPRRRRVGRFRRASRQVKRALRGRGGRRALIALACLALLLGGLFAKGFLTSPGAAAKDPSALLGEAGAGKTSTAAVSPAVSPSSAARPRRPSTTPPPNSILQTLQNSLPDNPLNHLRGAEVHQVTISAMSAEPMPLVGWLVPTGLTSPYKAVHPHTTQWSLTQRAVGHGYLAAVFIQAGITGAPVTCTVSVDGKVTNRETTSGAYGRAVCVG